MLALMKFGRGGQLLTSGTMGSSVLIRHFKSIRKNRKKSKPLRILFCGSDEFSIASLRVLHAAHKQNPDFIESIDVLCRPGKPTGRSLKSIRELPIKAAAQELGLALHERDTFTGWDLPNPNKESINLIIAVSFGLFVPSRILNAVEYGGLNVHPSLLPAYRGPAPLQHMLMRYAEGCGITLQTLDDKSFDHGKILAQRYFPFPPDVMTLQTLLDFVTPKAAKLLLSGLRGRLYVPPHIISTEWQFKLPKRLIHAAKITSADKRIFWQTKAACRNIPTRYRVLGRLWTSVLIDATTPKRLIFEDVEEVERPKEFSERESVCGRQEKEGPKEHLMPVIGDSVHFFVEDQELRQPILYIEDGDSIIFRTPVEAIRVKRITIEGQKTKDASTAMASLRLSDAWHLSRLPGTRPQGVCEFEALPKYQTNANVTSQDAGMKVDSENSERFDSERVDSERVDSEIGSTKSKSCDGANVKELANGTQPAP